MRERLGGRDVVKLLARAPAERSPTCGDDEATYLVGATAAQALGDRAVLGVDGDDLIGSLRCGGDELAADDEGFLVGQGRACCLR